MELQATLMSSSATSPSSYRAKQDSISPSSSVRRGVSPYDYDIQPSWIQEYIGDFEVVADDVELSGFQLYAVEKWVVERKRLLTSIAVKTPDESNKIYATVLQPRASLSNAEIEAEFSAAITNLRRDGARPFETDLGVIMITLLPNFRPDLAIVPIPSGSLKAVQHKFFANINLLRMGCSGRSALTLDEPSDPTKEKFVQIYHFPEYMSQCGASASRTHVPSGSLQITSSTFTKSTKASKESKGSQFEQPAFQSTVLNLVKLVQSALSIFGYFDIAEDERDGLLCDITVEGIRRCIVDDLSRLVDVEPTELVLDPSVLAALFSVIVSIRNKLQTLGGAFIRDPFVDPTLFLKALWEFQSTIAVPKHRHTQSMSAVQSPQSGPKVEPYLRYDLIRKIDKAYAAKIRSPEPYKVHRVLKHKLDDGIAKASNFSENLASNISGTAAALGITSSSNDTEHPGLAGYHHGPPLISLETPLTDLETFVRMVIGSGWKEANGGVDTLRYVWTGKANAGSREWERRERAPRILQEQERLHRQNRRDREREITVTQQMVDRRADSKDVVEKTKSDGEDGALSKLQRIFGSSRADLGVGRSRRGTDLQGNMDEGPTSAAQSPVNKRPELPSVMVTQPSGLDIHSSLPSPTKDGNWQAPSEMPSPAFGPSMPPSASQVFELPKRPARPNDGTFTRPASMGAYPDESDYGPWDHTPEKLRNTRPGAHDASDGDIDDDLRLEPGKDERFYEGDEATTDGPQPPWWVRKQPKRQTFERRHSISHCSEYHGYQLMPRGHMRADVDLCGAYFELEARSEEMDRIVRLLETLLAASEDSNAQLASHAQVLTEAYSRGVQQRTELLTEWKTVIGETSQVVTVGESLDYRTKDMETGITRLKETLRGYDKRTNKAMNQAAAEGALDFLKAEGPNAGNESEAKSMSVDQNVSQLKQRHPTKGNP